MSRYSLIEKQSGNLETVKDNICGTKLEISLREAVLLNYFIPIENNFLNIIDGFLTPEELMHSPSARSRVDRHPVIRDRRRDSIAVEPMQFITNAFNRKISLKWKRYS